MLLELDAMALHTAAMTFSRFHSVPLILSGLVGAFAGALGAAVPLARFFGAGFFGSGGVAVLRVMRGMLFSGRVAVQPYRGAQKQNPAEAGSLLVAVRLLESHNNNALGRRLYRLHSVPHPLNSRVRCERIATPATIGVERHRPRQGVRHRPLTGAVRH